MSENNITPTPWFIGEAIHVKYNEPHLFINNTKEAGRTVCSISPIEDLDDQDIANAKHIVKCVNNFNELVEALESVLKDPALPALSYRIEEMINSVLTKVKQK